MQESANLVRRGQTQALRQWRRLPLMDRWLTGELLGPLLFGIAAFTAVTLSVGVLFELVRKVAEAGLPMAIAVQVLFLRLPGFLVLSFPMATLIATLLQPHVSSKRRKQGNKKSGHGGRFFNTAVFFCEVSRLSPPWPQTRRRPQPCLWPSCRHRKESTSRA